MGREPAADQVDVNKGKGESQSKWPSSTRFRYGAEIKKEQLPCSFFISIVIHLAM